MRLATQVMWWQHLHNRSGSFEQPPACGSWRKNRVQAMLLLEGWRRFVWPSCAWGHRDPGNGRPWLKKQAFATNLDFSPLQLECKCGKGRSRFSSPAPHTTHHAPTHPPPTYTHTHAHAHRTHAHTHKTHTRARTLTHTRAQTQARNYMFFSKRASESNVFRYTKK